MRRKEGRELQSAHEQVSRAQENLGNGRAGTKGGAGTLPDLDWGDDERGERGAKGAGKPGADGRPQSEATGRGRARRHAGRFQCRNRPAALAVSSGYRQVRADPGAAGSRGRGRGVRVPGAHPAAAGPAARGERARCVASLRHRSRQALSSERYPDRHKEFIRRYFLNLSQGERPSREQSPGTRSVP